MSNLKKVATMEIIEKQVEKVKEVPYDNYYCSRDKYASKGVAGTGLGLGIAGTALGLLALGRSGFSLFGGGANGLSVPENININALNGTTSNGVNSPSAFQAWEKGCEDTLALQKGLYDWALAQQSQRFNDRQTLNSELFSIWKGQIDADFGLYKSLNTKQNENAFSLYKSQRDADDAIRKELSDLKAQVAINAAVRPYQDKLIQCEIDKAFTAGVNYTDRKTCKAIYGEVCLPNAPVITGYAGVNQCGCTRVVNTPATT